MEEWLDFQLEEIDQHTTHAVFLYTPLCGTCKVAERMITVVEELVPHLPIKKVNLNYIPKISEQLEIQSVPCLLLFKEGQLKKRIFAFQSVDFLYTELKNI
ncbi:thioredoxin family protein [Bacillus sp. DJP31]|uniref:thioredoxin family protein n=1 Tax=Bacillus sp. DJP31 TaxID=3409789 RepID=UPI003BB5DB9B